MKAIIFDFDGVIHDTFDFHLRNVRELFGVDIPEQDFRDIHNGRFFDLASNTLSGADWKAYRDRIRDDMSNLEIHGETRDFLLDLTKRFYLFIVSSGSTFIITEYLKKNGVDSAFTRILGLNADGHDTKVDKFGYILQNYDLTADQCLFVTDTLGDILDAKEAGIRTIAIDTGYHDRETLLIGQPHAIISKLNELHGILDSIEI
ncbi:MAG: HAD family hydrolase [Candidatus Moraniibacteriota bacterium]